MIRPIDVPPHLERGPFILIASSATVEGEWNTAARRSSDGYAFAFTQLGTTPFARIPGRQYPLRGGAFRPFWELEATSGERIFYVASTISNGLGVTIIVGVRNDIHAAPKLLKMLNGRRPAYEAAYKHAVAEFQVLTRGITDEPLRVPPWALSKRR